MKTAFSFAEIFFRLRGVFISIPVIYAFCFCSTFCQVPFSQVKNDVQKEYSGATVVDRGLGSKIEIDKTVFPNQKYWLTFVRASNKRKMDGFDITAHRNLDVRYNLSGSKYIFASANKFDYWLIGVPNSPTLAIVSGIINKDLQKFFNPATYNKVTEFGGIKEIIKEKYECFECDNYKWEGDFEGKRVRFRVKAGYTLINNNNLEKHEDIFEVILLRDGINQPWKEIQEGGSTAEGKRMPIETKTLTNQEVEYWKCNTLGMKYLKQYAAEEFKKLPKVDIPQFKTAEEMAWWTHRFLRKATPLEVEYVLLTKLHPSYFSACGNYILSENGYNLLESIKQFVSAGKGSYADHYCEYPKIKHQQGNNQQYSIQFYTKLDNKFSRIEVAFIKDDFKITTLELNSYREQSEIEALKSISQEKCNEFAPASWSTYKIDEVKVSAIFPKEPKKETFPNNPNRFSLTANSNNVEWTIAGEKVGQDILKQIKDESQRPSTAKLWSENFRTSLGAPSGRDGWWQYKKTQGYETTWKVKKDGEYIEFKYKAILYKDIYYQFWVFGVTDQASIDKFMNSIVIDR